MDRPRGLPAAWRTFLVTTGTVQSDGSHGSPLDRDGICFDAQADNSCLEPLTKPHPGPLLRKERESSPPYEGSLLRTRRGRVPLLVKVLSFAQGEGEFPSL